MNGYWKNSIGGWNHKDSKRKKQTRKNYIRDRGKILHKLFIRDSKKRERLVNEDIYRVENEVTYIRTYGHIWPEMLKPKNTVEVWKVLYNDKIYIVWEHYGSYYDDVTNEYIDFKIEFDSHNFRKIELLDIVGYDNSGELEKANKVFNSLYRCNLTKKEFFLGKPLLKKDINWDDGKRRGYYQKEAHSKDRASLRDWISKGDWDSEIKTHADSKSIDWSVW